MTTSEILRAAAARVRQGWCQGAGQDAHGNLCAVGAICDSATKDAGYFEAAVVLREVLDIESIAVWNDTPGRTKEEVALTLERAADYWDAQQTPAIVWTMREDVPA